MDNHTKASRQQFEDYFKQLRKVVVKEVYEWLQKSGKKGNMSEIMIQKLVLLPDLFHLGVDLLFDNSIPAEKKGGIVLGLAYVVAPIDLIPDLISVEGWVDDLVVMALALNNFFEMQDKATLDIVRGAWEGSEDVFSNVQEVLKIADSATEVLPAELMKIIKSMFPKGN